MPDAPGLELILGEINEVTPGAVLDTSFDREQAALIIDPAHVIAVLSWLKDTPGQEYSFLSSVHGADYYPGEPRFAVHYELLNRERHERLRVKAVLADPAAVAVAGTGSAGIRAERLPADPAPGAAAPAPAAAPAAMAVPATGSESSGSLSARIPVDSPPATDTVDGLPHLDSVVGLFPTADFQEREVYDFFGIVFDGHPDLRRILMPDDYVGWPQRRDFPLGGEPVIFTRDEVTNPGWWQ